jgi:Co/Zn/Cd efflux system component
MCNYDLTILEALVLLIKLILFSCFIVSPAVESIKKETNIKKKIIKGIIYFGLLLLAIWWFSKPMEIIFDPTSSPL